MHRVNLFHLYDKMWNSSPSLQDGFTISKVHCVRGMLFRSFKFLSSISGQPRLLPKKEARTVADSQQEDRLFHTHSRQPFTIPAAARVKAQSPEAFSYPLSPLPHFLCHAGPTASSCRHPFFNLCAAEQTCTTHAAVSSKY